jgi:hypothetical protein
LTRGIAAALTIWSVVATAWFLFFSGGHVMSCLGPLNVTAESCRAANGLPPETDIDRFLAGPGVLIVALAVGWATILMAGRWWKRQRARR